MLFKNAKFSPYIAPQISLSGTIGRNYVVGDAGLTITPFASLSYGLYHQEDYAESGAGSANLIVKDLYRHSVKPGIGFTMRNTHDWSEDYRFSPYFTAHIQREIGDNQSAITTAFEASSSSQFTTDSLKSKRTSINGTLGFKWLAIEGGDPDYDVAYSTSQNTQSTNHTATVKMNWNW